ncbi:MAG TPA: FtsX-like permease family protein, partial [Candidatus Sulfopaludibacter sp.]|nr:FtsX-like permease family protein [Candidatus Sulfopaludibacter sp.]
AAIADLARDFAAAPGVRSVTFAAEPPVGHNIISTATAPRTGEIVNTDPMIAYRLIGPNYFETIGAHMAAGRSLTEDEVLQFRPVVVLNQAAARLLFHGENPVGRTVHSSFQDRRSVVVGVVKDIRSEGLDQPSAPMVYMPFLPWGTPRYVVRADTAPTTLVSLLKSRARTRDSAIALRHFETLRQVLDDTVRNRVLAGILVGGFALLGLFISSVGLYGTLAAQVQHRSREIGVRIALGATVRDIVGGVMADGIRILAAGTAAGLAVSAAAASLVSPHLYGVHALDPASFAFAVTLLSAAALAACLIPALKAARLDPIRTLNVQ